MFGARFWRLVVALVVIGAGVWSIRESYFRGWAHGHNRARCDYTDEPAFCSGIDEMGAPR